MALRWPVNADASGVVHAGQPCSRLSLHRFISGTNARCKSLEAAAQSHEGSTPPHLPDHAPAPAYWRQRLLTVIAIPQSCSQH